MDTSKVYKASEVESKWYDFWKKNGYFQSTPDERDSYTIVIPPPNVTGVLHMGHMLNNTIQDALIRRARMKGYNALWVPGTDHASIATEAKVVQKLKAEGIDKKEIGREKFMEHAWEWTHKHGGIIFQQLERLGASCDWTRSRFTMEKELYDSVIKVFVDLHQKGLIYRGYRMVNWDPSALTAVSDEEVIHKEISAKLYYVRYKISGSDEFLTVATTRPETIMGDTAICVHPDDSRYKHLQGKKAIVPIVNREVPIICDDYIDPEFGTGALKVTPAHDINDYEIGRKHNLEIIDTLNADGTLSEAAEVLIGLDRFEARKQMPELLETAGALVKIEDYQTKLGYSERTDAVIEPRLSMQWFLKMEELAKPALDVVLKREVQLVPAKFENTYKHWMENVRDWCISRQLWWGHQIPAYYFGKSAEDYVVAENIEDALALAKEKSGNNKLQISDLKQDEDVLDTWFSSWLWPISVFDGIVHPNNEEIKYYYPTKDLVTAPEILFFWVARMIIAGIEYMDAIPFEKVYLTGIVRDKLGRKMSKSLGNSPDPIELIETYGADGVRVGMLLSSPAGNDLPFDIALCEQGRNFLNKIWNSYRLIKSWSIEEKDSPAYAVEACNWFESRFAKELEHQEQLYSEYRMSEVLMSNYRLVWDDYCSWFLEAIKPPYGEAIDKRTFDSCIGFLENILKVLHPFTPFLTEEIWQDIAPRSKEEALIVSQWPEVKPANESILKSFEDTQKCITELRNFRKKQQIPNKEKLELVRVKHDESEAVVDSVLYKLGNLSVLHDSEDKIDRAYSFVIGRNEYFIPLGDTIDIEAEKEKISAELTYTRGFLNAVEKKLNNERFVQNAPEAVVAVEQKKRDDARSKIDLLEKQLADLS